MCVVVRGKDEGVQDEVYVLGEAEERVREASSTTRTAVEWLRSRSSRTRLPLQLDRSTVRFLLSLFPASITMRKTYVITEVQQ